MMYGCSKIKLSLLPLVGSGTLKDLFHASCLVVVELEILSRLRDPWGVKHCSVLVN